MQLKPRKNVPIESHANSCNDAVESNTGSGTPKAKDYGKGLFPVQILRNNFALIYNSLLRMI